MLHIKSRAGVRGALAGGASPKLMVAALGLIDALEEATAPGGGWAPARHGWVVVVEAPEELEALGGLGLGTETFAEAPRAAVEALPELGCYAVALPQGTAFGLTLVVPADFVGPAVRAALDADAHSLCLARPALATAARRPAS
jgi:hypothetical protein